MYIVENGSIMAGRFTVKQQLEIIQDAEKYGNIYAADEHDCCMKAVRKIRDKKDLILQKIKEAAELDAKKGLRRNFAVKQDDGSVKKVQKDIYGNVSRYLRKRFVNEDSHGRHTVRHSMIF